MATIMEMDQIVVNMDKKQVDTAMYQLQIEIDEQQEVGVFKHNIKKNCGDCEMPIDYGIVYFVLIEDV